MLHDGVRAGSKRLTGRTLDKGDHVLHPVLLERLLREFGIWPGKVKGRDL